MTDFDFDFVSGVEDSDAAVLFIAGTCSALGPDFQREHHLPLFPGAELVTIDDAGHRLWIEQPDAVMAAVEAFLDAP